MLIDSHCHLNMLDLSEFEHSLQNVIDTAKQNDVSEFLCVSVEYDDHITLASIADKYPEVLFSVGIHPTGHKQDQIGEAVLTETAA